MSITRHGAEMFLTRVPTTSGQGAALRLLEALSIVHTGTLWQMGAILRLHRTFSSDALNQKLQAVHPKSAFRRGDLALADELAANTKQALAPLGEVCLVSSRLTYLAVLAFGLAALLKLHLSA